MKPTPIFVAAAGFAMIGACTVKTEDNTAENTDANSTMTANESVFPTAGNEASAGSDTLGNQMDQLNASDAEAANAAENATETSSNSG
jgi:hypothetical protein